MSHTFTHEHGRIHYNPDLSGDVEIINSDKQEIKVPGEMILAFVAEVVRRKRIEALEDASDEEIFK